MKKLMFIAILLSACADNVSFSTLETARKQAHDNALINAKTWRSQTIAYAKLSIIANGDSSQKPNCPQGDGWASIDLVNDNGTVVTSLKCSTVSRSVGCRANDQFKASPYANEDGWCQATSKVPFPIPKIAE